MVAAGWTVLAALPFAAYGRIPPVRGALLGYCAIWLGLVGVALWGQRNASRRLLRVALEADGLRFGGPDRERSTFVPWGQIEDLEAFSYPDRDAIYIAGKGGLRLRFEGRAFFVYEHIDGFARLSEEIRAKALPVVASGPRSEDTGG